MIKQGLVLSLDGILVTSMPTVGVANIISNYVCETMTGDEGLFVLGSGIVLEPPEWVQRCTPYRSVISGYVHQSVGLFAEVVRKGYFVPQQVYHQSWHGVDLSTCQPALIPARASVFNSLLHRTIIVTVVKRPLARAKRRRVNSSGVGLDAGTGISYMTTTYAYTLS